LTVADFNGDSFKDIIIGSMDGKTGHGNVTIIYGNTNKMSNIDLQTISECPNLGVQILDSTSDGPDSYNDVGLISTAGDMNGDTKEDLIIRFVERDKNFAYLVYGRERLECSTGCICCTSPTYCTSCSSGFELINNECVNLIPEPETEGNPEEEEPEPVPKEEEPEPVPEEEEPEPIPEEEEPEPLPEHKINWTYGKIFLFVFI